MADPGVPAKVAPPSLLGLPSDELAALREAIDALPIGILIAEARPGSGPIIVAHNRAYERIVGEKVPAGAAFGDLPYGMYHPDREDPYPPADWPGPRAARTGEPVREQEVHLRRRDGEWRVLSVSAAPLPTGARGPSHRAVSVLLDVTDRHESQGRLRRYELLAEHSRDIMLFLRREDGRILEANQAACTAYGYAREALLGLTIHDLRDAGVQPLTAAQLAEADATGLSFETIHRRKDGTTFPVEVSSKGASIDGTRMMVSVIRDLSERRKLEQQLQQAQKLESVGRLAGGIAHDFNNLLTVVLSCAECLREDLAAHRAVNPEIVEEIQSAGARASELTQQLLVFARRQPIAPLSLDLNAVVSGSERLLRRVLGEDIDLVVKAQPGVWRTYCDPGQIEQIILNLAVNARDAMPAGGRLVIETSNLVAGAPHRSLHPDMAPGDYVRLFVQDTGIGMAEEVQQHLFEPFFTTKAVGKGTGLGLASVYGIVKQSGGFIRVESEAGRGTAFEICFPRTHDAPAIPSRSPDLTPRRGFETILLVEDNQAVRDVTARALRGGGYDVCVAATGAEALDLVQRRAEPVHLVVTDLVMPGMDGRALAELLRAEDPDLRVLFVSGYAQDTVEHRGVPGLAVEFLAKPFTPATLLARVRAVLDA